MNGVLYIAFGDNARRQAQYSINYLRRFHDWPVSVIAESGVFDGADFIPFPDEDAGARWAKVNLDLITPYDMTLYMDADTRTQGDLSAGFEILSDGWELVIIPSPNQGDEVLWHCDSDDRIETFKDYGTSNVLQLQGGVFWFRKCDNVVRFFEAWRDEWQKFRGQDQAALLRAMMRAPVKTWLLGRPFNGGAVIKHLWGWARR